LRNCNPKRRCITLADLYVNVAFGTAHTKPMAPLISNPKRPFAAIVGDLKAQGLSVGSSLVEEDKLDLSTTLLAKAKGVSLLLPTNMVIADKFAPDSNSSLPLCHHHYRKSIMASQETQDQPPLWEYVTKLEKQEVEFSTPLEDAASKSFVSTRDYDPDRQWAEER
ncbi:3-phosphoglycerate kinase, partial [Tanacetum coccineum]